MRKLSRNIIAILFLLSSIGLAAQQLDSSSLRRESHGSQIGVFPKKQSDALYNFKVGGVYRFFGTYSVMKKDYILNEAGSDTAQKRTLFIGDDSQLPNLTLNFSGRPDKKTAWGFDLYAFQFLDGNTNVTYGTGQVLPQNRPTVFNPLNGTRLATNLNLQLGINLYGNFDTDFGVFGIKTGGIHWTSISDLTLAAFTGYNRFTLFERNPWDPITRKASDRYSSYFGQGAINQGVRWGEKAFTGTIIEGSSLPGNLSFKALYGKTELNGGFLSIPNISYGGQVKKATKSGFVAINTMNSQTYLDSLTSESLGFNIVTGEIHKAFKNGIEIKGEMGMGRYFSPIHSGDWGEAINLKFNFTKKVVKIPTEVHIFRISPKVINNNAIFFNSAIVEANNAIPAGSVGSSAALAPFASSLTAIGQFTNNRQGININSEYEVNKKLKFSFANGISTEIEGLSNQISYGHPVNQLTRSRLWRWDFPTSVGPYGRYNVIFRDAYELMTITDTAVAKKFNVIEFQTKYHTKLSNRDLYIFLLSRLSSVQDFLSPITVFSEKAYLRHYSHELEMYYSLNPKTIITTYLGYESAVANYSTEVDAISKRPRNQRGWGVGLGVDYDIAKNTALYFRHRWFNFEDRSFSRDAFAGKETVLELKFSF